MTVAPNFLKKMQTLLGTEAEAFFTALAADPVRGLRLNALADPLPDVTQLPFTVQPLGAFAPHGYQVLDANAQVGRHPYHAAGLYYSQDPAAMAVGYLVDPQPGELVLDLCAAPGGKSTHLAMLMQGQGTLVANEIIPKRAKYLVENLERCGVTNAIVTSVEPAKLADHFGPVFDRVLVDAPCSGEGMLRKMDAVEWSEAIVTACAQRQTNILAEAAALVRPGGRLVYSTCTFSPEEDEQQIEKFLQAHPDFALVAPPDQPEFDHGRPEWGTTNNPEIAKTIRLWPHRMTGEGHFVAVLENQSFGGSVKLRTAKRMRLPTATEQLLLPFMQHDLARIRSHVRQFRDILYLDTDHQLMLDGLYVVRAGLQLGRVGRSHFQPLHGLALAKPAITAGTTVSFAVEDPQLQDYLRGQDLSGIDGPNGWVQVCVDQYPLGWAKKVGNRLKNHYPKGSRIKK